MKLLNSNVRYTSIATGVAVAKAAPQVQIENLTDSLVFKYDKTKGNGIDVNIAYDNFTTGHTISYKVNGVLQTMYFTINPGAGTRKTLTTTINLVGLPNTGEIELIMGLGLEKDIELVGSAITEVVTFSKYNLESYRSITFKNATNLIAVPKVIPRHWESLDRIFEGCTNLNDANIGFWDVSNIRRANYAFSQCVKFNRPLPWRLPVLRQATGMFSGASIFNQNISGWCIPLILTEPTNFSLNSPLTAPNKPVWGTCPVKDADLEFNITSVGPVYLTLVAGEKVYFTDVETNVTSLVLTAATTGLATIPKQVHYGKLVVKTVPYSNVRYWGGAIMTLIALPPVVAFCTAFKSINALDTSKTNTVSFLGNPASGTFVIPAYLRDLSSMFEKCDSLVSVYRIITLGQPTNMSKMFYECINLDDQTANGSLPFALDFLKYMDVSMVTDFSYAFYNVYWHNFDVGGWDVSSATNMTYMFGLRVSWSNPVFNRDLTKWCVANITAEPAGFSVYQPLTAANKPKWGTCLYNLSNKFNVVLATEFRDSYDTYHTTDCLIDSNAFSDNKGSITPNNQLTWSGGVCNIVSIGSGLYKETKNTNTYPIFSVTLNANIGSFINIELEGKIYKLTRYDSYGGITTYWTDNWLAEPPTWTQKPPYLNGAFLLKVIV